MIGLTFLQRPTHGISHGFMDSWLRGTRVLRQDLIQLLNGAGLKGVLEVGLLSSCELLVTRRFACAGIACWPWPAGACAMRAAPDRVNGTRLPFAMSMELMTPAVAR